MARASESWASPASAAKSAGLKPATPKKKATRAAKSAAPRAPSRSAADDSPPPDTDQ